MKRGRLLYVIPECYVDTNLIEYLLEAGVNHQHSCSKVVARLNTTFVDRFAIGIIDKDKVQLGYVQKCDEIVRTSHLALMKHRNRHQYLITIAPAVDKFLLDCAEDQMVDTEVLGLPSDLRKFTEETKRVESNLDSRFKSLFAAIENHAEIRSLGIALKYLCDSQYASDNKRLREIFTGR